MSLNKQTGYVKGLIDGLDLDENKPEVKVILALADALEKADDTILKLQERVDYLENAVECNEDEIEDLYNIAKDTFDIIKHDYDDLDDLDDFDDYYYEDDEDYYDEDNPVYEVTCSKCNEKIYVTEDELLEGEIKCPECGETLEFDFSELEEHDCDCGCEECSHDHDHFDEDLMS